MGITIRLLFLIVNAILILSAQPVLSQEQHPDLQKGIAEFRDENFEEAIDSLLKAITADPESSLPSYYLGMTYKNLQNYSEAKKYFKNATRLEPKIKEVYLELAEVHYQMGELQEAMDVLIKTESENVRPGQTAYMKGLVLLKMNNNVDAVESFKKAGELSPELVQAADYQMGLAYMKEGQLEEAMAQFNEVINSAPDSDMAVFARNYLDKIPRTKRIETPIRYYLGLHFQYDDNVVLRPEDESAAIDITDEGDYREVLTGGIEYYPQLKGPAGLEAHYSFYYSNHHDISSYNVHSHSLSLVPNYKINQVSKAGLALSGSFTWVDDDNYLATGSISPTYTYSFAKDHTLQTYVTYQKKDFLGPLNDPDEDRDANEYSLTFNWFYFFSQDRGVLIPFTEKFDLSSFAQNKGYFNFMYKVSLNDTEGKNWEYVGSRWVATTVVPLHEKVMLRVSGEANYRNFINTHTVYDIERRDIGYGLSTLLFYSVLKHVDIQLLYAYLTEDSNIALYDYDRNLYSIGVEVRY